MDEETVWTDKEKENTRGISRRKETDLGEAGRVLRGMPGRRRV